MKKLAYILAVIAFFGSVDIAEAALQLVSTSTSAFSDSGTVSWNHTVPAGDNRLLVVVFSGGDLSCFNGGTYGGVALTSYASKTDEQDFYISYMIAPPVGTASISFSRCSSWYAIAGAYSFSGAAQTSPLEGGTSAVGHGTSPTLSVTTGESSKYVLDVGGYKQNSAPSPGAGQTALWVLASGVDGGVAYYSSREQISSSPTTMSWSGGTSSWTILAAGVKEAVATAASGRRLRGSGITR